MALILSRAEVIVATDVDRGYQTYAASVILSYNPRQSPPMRLIAGTRLGSYDVLRSLGPGGPAFARAGTADASFVGSAEAMVSTR